MKLQAKAGSQFATIDGGEVGEGLAIFFSQDATTSVRWRLEVSASLDDGSERLVGSFYVSPPLATNPLGALTRQVAAAVCPGAKSWSVVCYAAGGPIAAPEQGASIELASSKCCTAPVGLSRVSERYGYYAGVVGGVAASINLLPGQTVTRISATATGAGFVTIGAGQTVLVPVGTSAVLEPRAPIPQIVAAISFTNVNYVVEYLESA